MAASCSALPQRSGEPVLDYTAAAADADNVTGKLTAIPDSDPLDGTFYPVSAIEHVAQQVIRKAQPASRQAMWDAYQGAVVTVTEKSPDRMPWDPPDSVSRISLGSAEAALKAMLTAVPDRAEVKRLAAITAAEAEKVEQALEASGEPGTDTAGWMPRCRWCGEPCKDKRAKWCKPSHRNAAWKARQRAKRRQGNGNPA